MKGPAIRRALALTVVGILGMLYAAEAAQPTPRPDFLGMLLAPPAPLLRFDALAKENETAGLQDALEWRRLTMLDEHGRLNARGPYEAALHRRNSLAHHGQSASRFAALSTITTSSWLQRGPTNVGGRTRALLINPSNPQIMYAGAASGGVWITYDGGQNWTPSNGFMNSLAVGSMAFDPTSSQIIYAGTGEWNQGYGDGILGAGVFKSIDAGLTWTRMPGTYETNPDPAHQTHEWDAVTAIAVSPVDSTNVLAGASNGIWKMQPDGSGWQKIYPANQGATFHATSIAFDSTGTHIIATGWNGSLWTAVYAQNGGAFTPATVQAGDNSYDILATFAPAGPPGTVYMMRGAHDLLTSGDYGATYNLVSANFPSDPVHQVDTSAIWVAPNDSSFILAGGLALWKSIDSGAHFSQIASGNGDTHVDFHCLVTAPGYGSSNHTVFACTDGGVFKAPDITTVSKGSGGGWLSLNQNYQSSQFYAAAGTSFSTAPMLGGTQDNGTLLRSSTNSFTQINCCDGGMVAIDPLDTNILYGEAQNLSLARTLTGSQMFFFALGITEAGNRDLTNFIAPFVLDPNNRNTMLGGGSQLWRNRYATSNPAQNFESIRPSDPARISAVAVQPGNSDVVWVAFNDGRIDRTFNGTAPAGSVVWNNWVDNNSSIQTTLPDRYPTRIVFDPVDANTVYVTFGGFAFDGLHRTTNGGADWTQITGPSNDITKQLPPCPKRAIVRHPRNSNQLYVATDVGLYQSDDAGLTWTTSNDGPGDVAIDDVNFIAGTETLLVATHGRGLWTADTSTLVQTLKPTNVTATLTAVTWQILVQWLAVSGASSYRVWRSSDGGPYAIIATDLVSAYDYDNNVVAGKTYLYKVQAKVNGVWTDFSNIDLATTKRFTLDNGLSGQPILSTYLQEIRDATNMVMAAAGLSPLSFSDTAAPGLAIKANHITDLRNGLVTAYGRIGMTAPSWVDSITANVTTIKGSHVQEIREATK